MKYLLDTNAIIALFKGHPGFLARIHQCHVQDFALSSIVTYELFFGAYRSQRKPENLALVEALQFETLEFDRDDARCAGEIRARLTVAGTPIGPYDVLIAGQALARELTLITRNIREFERVEMLRVENWES